MSNDKDQAYIRKIKNDIANYHSTINGLQSSIRRAKSEKDDTSVRSFEAEIRRNEQTIKNLESQL